MRDVIKNETTADRTNKSRSEFSIRFKVDGEKKKQYKPTKRKMFTDMERRGTSTILFCTFNLLREITDVIVGLANQSCVRGSLCL